MTREEALETWLPVVEMAIVDANIPEAKEALEMAFKALEQEPCEDMISRKAVLDEMYKRKADGDAITAGFIKNLPSVTSQPKMGHWIEMQHPITDKVSSLRFVCSECDEMVEWSTSYCPACGAKMEGVKDDNK